MAVFETLFKIKNNTKNIQDIPKLLIDALQDFLQEFKKEELKLSHTKIDITDFDKVILLRDFGTELWNEILSPELNKNEITACASVIEKMLNRVLIQTKETLFLLGNDMGLSAIFNVRLFMEAYAITKYIIEKGEEEAIRFIDFSNYQHSLAAKNKLDFNLIKKYGEKSKSNKFYSIPYGWCSEEKITGEKLIKKTGNKDLLYFYRLTCNYIHASPFSLIQISNSSNPFFPIPSEILLKIVKFVLCNFLLLILNYCMKEERKRIYIWILSMLVPELIQIQEGE